MSKLGNLLRDFYTSQKFFIASFVILFIVLAIGLTNSQIFFRSQYKKSTVINHAGRQRMISQKLAKIALFQAAHNQDDAALAKEMKTLEHTWSQVHKALQEGNEDMGILVISNAKIDSLFVMIQPHKEAISTAVNTLTQNKADEPAKQQVLAEILYHEGEFLQGMDRLVAAYEHEAQSSIDRIRWMPLIAITVMLIILVFQIIPAYRFLVKKKPTSSGFIYATSGA